MRQPDRHASIFNAVLRNVSRSGAMLSGPASSIAQLAGQFYLIPPGQLRLIRCKIIWKTYDEVGIRFISDPGAVISALSPGDHDRIEQRSGAEAEPLVASVTAVETYHGMSPAARVQAVKVDASPGSDANEDSNDTFQKNDLVCGGQVLALQEMLDDSDVGYSCSADSDTSEYGDVCQLPLGLIVSNPRHPRQKFDPEQIAALAESVRDRGIIQPLLVRRLLGNQGYEIVAGELRRRAALLAGSRTVPAIIGEFSDAEALEAALIENLQRTDLSPVEEATAYVDLVDRFGYTQRQVARIAGKSRSYVCNMMRLLTLPEDVKAHVQTGLLSAGHARALAATEAPSELAKEIMERKLNVRQTEQLARSAKASGTRIVANRRDMDERGLDEVARKLGESLGVRVKISVQGSFGAHLTMYFRTMEELARTCRRLSVVC